jgi:hypothetical protein
VSFHFGLPSLRCWSASDDWARRSSRRTTVDEADGSKRAASDAIVAQGIEAAGIAGIF